MDEKEELKQELQWVQYRQKMLNIIEEKLLQMRLLSEQAKVGNLSSKELEVLNSSLKNLAEQVRAIDSESRRAEDGKILE
jgi:coenzyme F420-reducing hydrogenase delta subunit